MTAADCNENERYPFPLIRERQLKIRTKKFKKFKSIHAKVVIGFLGMLNPNIGPISVPSLGLWLLNSKLTTVLCRLSIERQVIFWVKLGSQICSDIDSINMDLC